MAHPNDCLQACTTIDAPALYASLAREKLSLRDMLFINVFHGWCCDAGSSLLFSLHRDLHSLHRVLAAGGCLQGCLGQSVRDRALEQFFKKVRIAGWEEDMAEVSMERHGRAKQLVVFYGAAGIGTAGGWGADAVLRACCKVVCRPRGTDQRRGRVVLVDEHCTTRVSSAVNGKQPLVAPRKPPQAPRSSQAATQPAASEPGPSTPPPAKRSKRSEAEPAAKPTKGKGKAQGKAAKAKSAPQRSRWLDQDCNAALNMQRIGESRWRPLELCYWPEQGALPAKGKGYPGLDCKRLQDKPPKAQEQQQPAVAP
ncbi:hypothetical protein QJQ45_007599 [Haematococcus lacustris]|nr:hypothetical protein QJQ45_007599 [Haematococcus lacustris]